MAKSSNFATNLSTVKYNISITQNSQNVANNTSNVTVSVQMVTTSGTVDIINGTVYLNVNGSQYTQGISGSISTSGRIVITKTINVTHASNGTKTLSAEAWITGNPVSSTAHNTYSQTLTTINRKSTLSVADGTLGTAQTLTVTRQATSLSHTIVATCGSASSTICTTSTTTSFSFTPPLTWASQNTTGTSVSVTYKITTYSGSTLVGDNSYSVSCAIPASVKPSCTVSVSDASNYAATYGGYLKGLSKFKITVTGTGSYSSTIKTYSVTANGLTYATANPTTGVVTTVGSNTISAKVTDSRGRVSDTKTTSATVIDYNKPSISKLTVIRCDQDGTENDQGEYSKITLSASVTSLTNKNKATYDLKYKSKSDSTWTTISTSNINNNYAPSDISYIFEANTSKSYDVSLTLTDNFTNVSRTTSVSTAATILNFHPSGTGLGIGKVSEEENKLDISWGTNFRESAIFYNARGLYGYDKNTDTTRFNIQPVNESGNCVIGYGNYDKQVGNTNIYGNGINILARTQVTIRGFNYGVNNVLFSGAAYMTASQTITLSKGVTSQPHGIILVFSRYSNGAANNDTFAYFFVPKQHVVSFPGQGICFGASNGNRSLTWNKYIYITDTTIVGNDLNYGAATGSDGVKYANTSIVLRQVLGV